MPFRNAQTELLKAFASAINKRLAKKRQALMFEDADNPFPFKPPQRLILLEHTMKRINTKQLLLISLLGALLALSACQEKGPAEKAGEKIDKMVNDSTGAMEEAVEDVQDAAEGLVDDMQDAVEDMTDDAEDAAEDMADDAEDAAEDMADDVEEATN